MSVWVVINPDNPTVPIGGVWTTLAAANDHCPDEDEYVVLKLEVDLDYLAHPVLN